MSLRTILKPIKSLLHSLIQRIQPTPEAIKPAASYAQCGEDLLLDYLLTRKLKIEQPRYLDIGAHHPTFLSNTYRFYQKGGQGVCVEPDPNLFQRFAAQRTRDTCLNACVGIDEREEADFFLLAPHTLNTLSREEAESCERRGVAKIRSVERIPQLQLNQIIQEHFSGQVDLVSIDVEGVDLQMLQTIDFEKYRPAVFVIESLDVDEAGRESKKEITVEFMESKGYMVYADTWINTIFVDCDRLAEWCSGRALTTSTGERANALRWAA